MIFSEPKKEDMNMLTIVYTVQYYLHILYICFTQNLFALPLIRLYGIIELELYP